MNSARLIQKAHQEPNNYAKLPKMRTTQSGRVWNKMRTTQSGLLCQATLLCQNPTPKWAVFRTKERINHALGLLTLVLMCATRARLGRN
jgi:hypothetical protein